MKPAKNIISLIGNTPMVKIQKLDTGKCELFLKLECQNPGGSIKDRIALEMIETAEKNGDLKPGSILVEATAGNTGLGLALIAALKNYRLIVVMPDKMSSEKMAHLRALGAEVIITRSDVTKEHPDYYQNIAERLASETPLAFYINQFANPANPIAHEKTTGPEIWEQTEGRIDALVVGVGSGGTLTGTSRYLRKKNPDIEIILADPEGSVLAHFVKTQQLKTAGSWLVEGIGEDFIPLNCDLSFVTEAITVTDKEAFAAIRNLLAQEGILAGSSSGTLLHAALTYCRAQKTPKRVITFACDTGNKYLSKAFNHEWLTQNNLI
jgi:cystathionine beta-synthase